jgi:hypothetical protein
MVFLGYLKYDCDLDKVVMVFLGYLKYDCDLDKVVMVFLGYQKRHLLLKILADGLIDLCLTPTLAVN